MQDVMVWWKGLEPHLPLAHSLGFHALSPLESTPTGARLTLFQDAGAPRQFLGEWLRPEAVAKHFQSWPLETLELYVAVNDDPPVLVALVKSGSLYWVSSSSEEQAGTTSGAGEPVTFHEWFQRLVGHPFPIPVDPLELRAENVWTPPGVAPEQVCGMPHRFRIEGLDSYTAVTFYGYGINTYALYYSRVQGPTRVFLRMPFGGVYMNREKTTAQLLYALEQVHSAQTLALDRGVPLFIVCNMGDLTVRLSSGEDSEILIRDDKFREEAMRRLHTAIDTFNVAGGGSR